VNPFSPLVNAIASLFGWLLAYLYEWVHNLALDIAIMTVLVLVPFTPLISRSIVKMSQQAEVMRRLAPQIQEIKKRFKDDRVRQSQEINALLAQENFSLTGGCLPLLPQFGVLFVFYLFIRGIFHQAKVNGNLVIRPLYLDHHTALYKELVRTGGHLSAFGMEMAQRIPAPSFHSAGWIPYWAVVLVGGMFSYLQVQRSMSRMPQNPQINQATQRTLNRVLPLLFLWFYFVLPISVDIYYATSAVVRFFQYEYVYWRNPSLVPAGAGKGPSSAPMSANGTSADQSQKKGSKARAGAKKGKQRSKQG
jgi:YidC/Oxa1 family membrane protein insertase